MKNILGLGATNYEILWASMVGQQRKCFISNRLKQLEKLNICKRQVTYYLELSEQHKMGHVQWGKDVL